MCIEKKIKDVSEFEIHCSLSTKLKQNIDFQFFTGKYN